MRTAFLLLAILVCVHDACAEIRIDERAAETRRRLHDGGLAIADLVAEALTPAVPVRKPRFLLPTIGRVSSLFGRRRDPLHGGRAFHEGIDIAHAPGAPVRASAGGRVVAAGFLGGCGLAAVIDHGGGLSTRYCHLEGLAIQPGEHILAGEGIGRMGSTGRSTGSHLHFELRDHGVPIDPAERLYY